MTAITMYKLSIRLILYCYLFVTIQQEYAFTADSVKKCIMTKQKSICEANLGWIFARNYEGTE